ncbi:MAG: hypothetical protein ABIE68_01910 [bacterium]
MSCFRDCINVVLHATATAAMQGRTDFPAKDLYDRVMVLLDLMKQELPPEELEKLSPNTQLDPKTTKYLGEIKDWLISCGLNPDGDVMPWI